MTLRRSGPSFSCILGTLVLASLAVSCGPKLDFSTATELAPGLVYTNHTLNTPWSVHILRVDRRATDLQFTPPTPIALLSASAPSPSRSTISEPSLRAGPRCGQRRLLSARKGIRR